VSFAVKNAVFSFGVLDVLASNDIQNIFSLSPQIGTPSLDRGPEEEVNYLSHSPSWQSGQECVPPPDDALRRPFPPTPGRAFRALVFW